MMIPLNTTMNIVQRPVSVVVTQSGNARPRQVLVTPLQGPTRTCTDFVGSGVSTVKPGNVDILLKAVLRTGKGLHYGGWTQVIVT